MFFNDIMCTDGKHVSYVLTLNNNEKKDSKQYLLDTPCRVMVNKKNYYLEKKLDKKNG